MRKAYWKQRTTSQNKHRGSEGHRRNEIKCINVWKKDRWLWDEVNSAQRFGSAPLFINQRLDFTELGWWLSIPPPPPPPPLLWQNIMTPKQKHRERANHGTAGMSPPSLSITTAWERESEREEAWPQHNSPAGDEVRHYSWPSQQPLLFGPK